MLGCGDGMVRGVNLGGWFVLEPWITPVFFEEVNDGGDMVSRRLKWTNVYPGANNYDSEDL